jgi:hypothetical protein
MEVRVRATGEVMFESELRSYLRANNGPSYDELTEEVMEAIGVDPVLEGPRPTHTRYQVSYRDGVEQINGQWFTKYSVADMDDESKAAVDAAQVRQVCEKRASKFLASDWTQLMDAKVDREAWAIYRQQLRDITDQPGFPWDIVWPEKPSLTGICVKRDEEIQGQ